MHVLKKKIRARTHARTHEKTYSQACGVQDHDRALAVRLQQMSAAEQLLRAAQNQADTSQHGNGHLWRNVSYTGIFHFIHWYLSYTGMPSPPHKTAR